MFRENFEPDIVIGNPPYNNGSDIDFIYESINLSSLGIVMVTPAKWQNCDGNQRIDSNHSYGDFRKDIVPHIERIVFYPDSSEVFEIRNTDGIVIYSCDKEKITDRCLVENRCLHQKYFNSIEERDIKNRQTLSNIGNRIIEELGDKVGAFRFDNIQGNKEYQVWTASQFNCGCGWGYSNRENPYSLVNLNGQLRGLGISKIVNRLNNEKDERGASTLVFESDSLDECKSFVSWIDSKLVRFLITVNAGKLNNIMTNDYFRFVPAPYKGYTQGLYEDKEIYNYFKLSQSSIDAIESIMIDLK
jgi:hypothetical protein